MQAECKYFTESGIGNKGYINPELQDLAMQFFSDFRQACHSFKNRLTAADFFK